MVLEAEGDLVVDLEHDELCLRILEQHSDRRRHRREPEVSGLGPLDADAAALPVGVDRVRDDAVEAKRQGALPAAARTEEQQPLAALPAEREIAERREPPADVTEGEPGDLRECAGHTSRTRSRPRAYALSEPVAAIASPRSFAAMPAAAPAITRTPRSAIRSVGSSAK